MLGSVNLFASLIRILFVCFFLFPFSVYFLFYICFGAYFLRFTPRHTPRTRKLTLAKNILNRFMCVCWLCTITRLVANLCIRFALSFAKKKHLQTRVWHTDKEKKKKTKIVNESNCSLSIHLGQNAGPTILEAAQQTTSITIRSFVITIMINVPSYQFTFHWA